MTAVALADHVSGFDAVLGGRRGVGVTYGDTAADVLAGHDCATEEYVRLCAMARRGERTESRALAAALIQRDPSLVAHDPDIPWRDLDKEPGQRLVAEVLRQTCLDLQRPWAQEGGARQLLELAGYPALSEDEASGRVPLVGADAETVLRGQMRRFAESMRRDDAAPVDWLHGRDFGARMWGKLSFVSALSELCAQAAVENPESTLKRLLGRDGRRRLAARAAFRGVQRLDEAAGYLSYEKWHRAFRDAFAGAEPYGIPISLAYLDEHRRALHDKLAHDLEIDYYLNRPQRSAP